MQPRTVGVALRAEKLEKHISERLLQLAAAAGITLKFIDTALPLEEQGPFDAVLQKIRAPEWEAELEAYASRHPETRIIDAPASTVSIRNRGTMISFLEDGGWLFEEPAAATVAASSNGRRMERCRCSVPTQTMLDEGSSYAAATAQLAAAGLRYPLLAKPLWADGRDGSHALAVVNSPEGLRQLVEGEARQALRLPVLLQQYVDHGGCLFKVYVLGPTAVRVKRSSLQLPPPPPPAAAAVAAAPACANGAAAAPAGMARQQSGSSAANGSPAAVQSEESWEAPPDLEIMHRVSAYPRCRSWGKWDLAPQGHGVQSPPDWFLQALAQRLRVELGLNLFNFDVIVPAGQEQQQKQQQGTGGSSGPSSPRVAAAPQQAQQQQQQAGVALYHLIDINYFPGYEKLPDYETLLVRFLCSIFEQPAAVAAQQQQQQQQLSGAAAAAQPGLQHSLPSSPVQVSSNGA